MTDIHRSYAACSQNPGKYDGRPPNSVRRKASSVLKGNMILLHSFVNESVRRYQFCKRQSLFMSRICSYWIKVCWLMHEPTSGKGCLLWTSHIHITALPIVLSERNCTKPIPNSGMDSVRFQTTIWHNSQINLTYLQHHRDNRVDWHF